MILFGNPRQLLIQIMGVGVADVMGFFGTFAIMKVIDKKIIGVRVVCQSRRGRP